MIQTEEISVQDQLRELQEIRASRKRAAAIGGEARAAALSKRRRSEIARKAGIASGAARAKKARQKGDK